MSNGILIRDLASEILIHERYCDLIKAEVWFKPNRELDEAESRMLTNEVRRMLTRIGSALYAGQLKKEQELHNLQETKEMAGAIEHFEHVKEEPIPSMTSRECLPIVKAPEEAQAAQGTRSN